MDAPSSPLAPSAETPAPVRTPGPRRLTDAQLRIVRLSLARSCTDAEFDHFIAVAERTGLDPLRRQISAIVVGAADPAKRAMIPLATIDGLRAIAARSGDYRPMEDAPVLEVDPAKKDEALNPLGLVRAEVKVWRRFGEVWFPITGEAWWDEYAAIADAPQPDGDASRDGPRSQPDDQRIKRLAGNWRRMGRILLQKCAEAQALRRGWPEDLSGLYGEEELNRAELEDLLAHERADRAAEEARQRALAGSRSLLIAFEDSGALEPVARQDLALKLAAFIVTAPKAETLETFQARNRAALKTFWEWSPSEAFDIKQQMERAVARLQAAEREERCTAPDTGELAGPLKPGGDKARKRGASDGPTLGQHVKKGAPMRPNVDPLSEGSQNAPPSRCRKKPGRALKARLLAAQGHACFACGGALLAVEYDHIIPLGLGGGNAEDNWAALCPACHKGKTRDDLRVIAKAKRQRRYQETGRSHAPRTGWNGRQASGGFDKTLRRRMNGTIERICSCKRCASSDN